MSEKYDAVSKIDGLIALTAFFSTGSNLIFLFLAFFFANLIELTKKKHDDELCSCRT